MELHYAVSQSDTDRLTFYLRPNLAPVYDGSADRYADALCRTEADAAKRVRRMDEWLAAEAHRMLDGHAIGQWCADKDRRHRIILNTSAVPYSNIIRLRFLSAADAALFKLTHG